MNATLHQAAMTATGKTAATPVHFDPNRGPVRLPEGHYVKTHDAQGWRIHALAGSVWITQDWDSRDIVLHAGESFVLDRDGAAMLWPLGDTSICIAKDGIPCAAQDALPAEREIFA
ncbi:MAG: hypothetical protein V7606_1307 [Burkholderiales bacterium]